MNKLSTSDKKTCIQCGLISDDICETVSDVSSCNIAVVIYQSKINDNN